MFFSHTTAAGSSLQGTQPPWKALWLFYGDGPSLYALACGHLVRLTVACGAQEFAQDWFTLRNMVPTSLAATTIYLLFFGLYARMARHCTARYVLVVHAPWMGWQVIDRGFAL